MASKANYIEQVAAFTRAKQIAAGDERAEAMLTTTDAQKEEALAAANVILDGVLHIYQGMNILISVCGHSGQSSRSLLMNVSPAHCVEAERIVSFQS